MKKVSKVFACIAAGLSLVAASLCTGCTAGSYTEEQHIQRVTARAEERFLGEGSEYTGLEVYPIYNEYDELNYMLIELEPQGFVYVLIRDDVTFEWISGVGMYLCSDMEPESWIPYRVHEGMREEVVDEDGHTTYYTNRELFRDENGDVIVYHQSHFKVAGIENERRYLLSIVSTVDYSSGSELGEQQKILVYPEYIDQIKVYGLGYHRQSIWYLEEVLDFESANLEKLFLPTNPKESDHPNAYLPNGVEVTWNLDRDNYGGIRQCKAAVWGYNYYVQFVKPYESNLTNYIANVSYMYNYAGAENEGYYWVDNYDEAVITFIPPDPERLGYLFGGWYKEPACITPWNFETDKTGELIVLDGSHGDYDTYEGTYLYAKWVRNS